MQSPAENDLLERVKTLTQEIQQLYLLDTIPWVIGYSGGKDSTAILQLVWWAIAKLPAEARKKVVHVITTDTLVESPIVSAWVAASHERMREAAARQGMPFEPRMLYPEIDQTFWVNLIGRGYPAPRPMFRWCTERMKIKPSNRFIREVVRASGEAILVLGTRKAESSRRSATMTRHEANRVRERLSPNSKLPNSLIFTPIEDWSNDDVWMYLMQVQNPWGYSNRDLMTLYAGASADNECPLVVDTSTPSCGNSRFGCWVCTMVERDRSMEAMIQNDEQKEWMQPLLDLRNELDDVEREKREGWREVRRMSGRVQLFNGEPIRGPYTRARREYWLRRLLQTQTELRRDGPAEVRDLELIRLEELREIRRIWRVDKHEFDDSLPRIYAEATGEPFPSAVETDNTLGADEYAVLAEICGDDATLVGLTATLLNTERQFRSMARRIGVYKALEDVLDRQGYAGDEDAVAEARAVEALRASSSHEQLSLLRAAAQAPADRDEVGP
jgi:DNA sulfur modification protein DndC